MLLSIHGVKRRVFAVAACELIPVPLLDTLLQNQIRRNLVRTVAEQHELVLYDCEVEDLADAPLTPGRRMVLWPVKKLLTKVFFVFGLVSAARSAHETMALARQVADLEN